MVIVLMMSSKTAKEQILPSQITYNGEDWSLVRSCGQGTFSNCFQIVNKSGQNLALKVYKPCERYESAFQNEDDVLSLSKSCLKSNSSSYIVNYIDSVIVSGQRCILMDLLGCSLKELIIKHESTRFSLFLVKKILHDLISAAMFLKDVSIVHGDIKPCNILWNMNTERFQLIDFSLSFKLGLPNRAQQPLQSVGYQAPEVVKWNKAIKGAGVNNAQDLDSSVDIWSIGCVLVYVITGEPLYRNEDVSQLSRFCTNCELKCFPCVHALNSTGIISSKRNELPVQEVINLTDIISGLLQCYSHNRFSPAYVLNHPFLLTSSAPDASINDLLLLPTTVLRFLNMFNETKREVIEDIILDIREECERFGKVMLVKTSKKNNEGYNVYVEYQNSEDCCEAQHLLTGRYFDNKLVVATFFPLQHFRKNRFY